MRSAVRIVAICTGLFLMMGAAPAGAHSFNYSDVINGVGAGESISLEHQDADDGYGYKGWANITVENTGTEAWGDFHFQIFEVTGFGSVENVNFLDASPNEPTSSQTGLSWVVDNVSVGATIDLYFYSDPVLPGETATFSVYTDNTIDQLGYFGTAFYPTPVPEPGTAILLGMGLMGLAASRRKN